MAPGAVAPTTASPLTSQSPKGSVKARNRKTPSSKSFRKSPLSVRNGKKLDKAEIKSKNAETERVWDNSGNKNVPIDEEESSFLDHSELCERMAKTFYFANKLPSTPRPSLPLTMLAVNTFASSARKDTLEFLDLEMAAEIGRNACVSPTAMIIALVYLERLKVSSHNPDYLNSIKPSELFVVSLLVASKFFQDDGEDLGIFNDEWATSAQMELKKLNRLELKFLTAIDWNVNVKKEEYNTVLERLESKLALDQGIKRGWFTYTEVGNLTNTLLAWNLIWPTLYEHCFKVITAACVTYATLIATVLTSSFLAPQIFFASRSFMTSSINSMSYTRNFVSNSCFNPGYPTNTSTDSTLPLLGSQGLTHGELGSLFAATDNSILDEENETDTSLSKQLQGMENFRSFNYHTQTKMLGKNPMNVKGRMKFGVINNNENPHTLTGGGDEDLNHCYLQENGSPPDALDEVFAQHIKSFLKQQQERERGSNMYRYFTGNENGDFPDRNAKCNQYLMQPQFPFGSVIKV